MEHSETCCVHCTHVFNVENLKEERRRSVGKQHKDVDLIKTLAFCYEVDEVKLRNAIGYDNTSFFVCSQCFNSLKATYVSLNKFRNLCDKLKASTSTSFINLSTNLSVSREQFDADEQINEDTEPPLPSLTPALSCLGSTARKRQRNIFTPSKSGCTPKSKRKTTTKTPKKNRRRLQFTSTCKSLDEKPTPQVTQSPGPKVKVYSTFNRAGFSTSYKSTLSRIDQICESFDIPVKNWAKAVSEQHNQDTSRQELSPSDHCYAQIVETDNELVTPSTPYTCSEKSPVIYIAEPISTSAADSDVHMDTSLQKTPGNFILQDNTSPGDHSCFAQTVETDNKLVNPSTPYTCSEESTVIYIAEPISTSAADSDVHMDTSLQKTPGLAVIKLSSTIFVLRLKNQPIKILDFMFRA